MPLQATSGAATYDAFGGGVPIVPNYIEEVFNTFLFVGNNSTLQIQNGINFAEKGGLIWEKTRNEVATWNLYDTNRGVTKRLMSNNDFAEQTTTGLTSFNTNGVTLASGDLNYANYNHVLFSFRKQPKFFDIVTWTGDGTAARTIAHNLGSSPGCIIAKATSATSNWPVFHRSVAQQGYLNSTASFTAADFTGDVSSTTFDVYGPLFGGILNNNGTTYVAYLFAHNAGGFGTSGTDNVISCGSYTGNGSTNGPTITLGYEPQWILYKRTTGTAVDWEIADIMRGLPVGTGDRVLFPNSSQAEVNAGSYIDLNATGFQVVGTGTDINANGATYIYIAIRRGPMKVPTDATKVFIPVNGVTVTGNGTPWPSPNFVPDSLLMAARSSTENRHWFDRLRGTPQLQPNVTNAETGYTSSFWAQDGFAINSASSGWVGYIGWNLGRAPGFFDVVCYTASADTDLIYHNLGVTPEFIIAKNRGATSTQWYIHHTGMASDREIYFNAGAENIGGVWTRTSTYFNNASALFPTGEPHVAYLFATLAGVSKVGSYSGTGATQNIDCGFTSGARFVLIKRTNDPFGSNNWFVWDTARGMVSGTDPRLALNLSSAEVNNNWVYTTSAGFQVVTNNSEVNASGGFYIFLAIA